MKKLSLAFLTASALLAPSLFAQEPQAAKAAPPPTAVSESQVVLAQWNEIGRKIIAIAEDLPESKYDYKPNPASRTFLGQILHVSASMYYFTDVAQGKKPRYPDEPETTNLKTKAQVLAFAKQCVDDGASFIKSKGDKGMNEIVVDPESKQPMHLSDLAFAINEHSGEHYGSLVIYYRNNGMVPPESRPKK